MKRAIAWGVIGGGVAGVLIFVFGVHRPETSMAVAETISQPADAAQPTDTPQPARATQPAPQTASGAPLSSASQPSGSGTIVHTFSDDAGVQEFARLWQRRQAALTRMAVLQTYVEEERPALEQLNERLLSQYHLEVSKNYSIDTERKVLIELPAPPATALGAPGRMDAEAPPPAQPQ